METELAHRIGIQQVSPIEYDRRGHPPFERGKVDIGKLIPFSGDDEGFGAVDGF